jgi:hypothetical protein
VWNLQAPMWANGEVREMVEPVIIHYVGHNKPWRRFRRKIGSWSTESPIASIRSLSEKGRGQRGSRNNGACAIFGTALFMKGVSLPAGSEDGARRTPSGERT